MLSGSELVNVSVNSDLGRVEAGSKSILVHDGERVDLHLSHPLLKNETTAEVTELLLQEEVPP